MGGAGITAAKPHQYARRDIYVTPRLQRYEDVAGGPLFHHVSSTFCSTRQ
jgi:hypothetical protein